MSVNQEKLSAKLSPKGLFNDKKCMILMIEMLIYKIFIFWDFSICKVMLKGDIIAEMAWIYSKFKKKY